MLVRIDASEDQIVEQGDGYIVVRLDRYDASGYACKVRTTRSDKPCTFEDGDVNDIEAACSILVEDSGEVSLYTRGYEQVLAGS